jgi:hypothetical protein
MALSYKTKMTEISVKKTPGIQILIADDSSLLRDRIKSLLNSIKNVCVVGEAEDFEDINIVISELANSEKKV